MAYLRKSQVTGLSPRGIDLNTITTPTGARINGDITSHTLKMADTFTVVDDITISDNLILAKVSDDGDDLILTSDNVSDRTIEGSGSIEGSTIAQTPNASLTGMTGVLDSAVTGGSGLTALGTVASGTIGSGVTGTLGSGVTFPAGHILQVLYANQEDYGTQLSADTETKINSVNLTTIGTNSNFIIMCNVSHEVENVDADPCAAIGYKTGATSSTSTDYSAIHGAYSREVIGNMGSWYTQDTIGGSTAGTWGGAYQIRERSYQDKIDLSYAAGTQLDFASWIRAGGNPCRFGTSRNDSGGDNGCTIYLTVMEIAG